MRWFDTWSDLNGVRCFHPWRGVRVVRDFKASSSRVLSRWRGVVISTYLLYVPISGLIPHALRNSAWRKDGGTVKLRIEGHEKIETAELFEVRCGRLPVVKLDIACLDATRFGAWRSRHQGCGSGAG